METLKLKLTGTRPLLMHNIQLADPFNRFAKALKAANDAAKGKNKTDENLEAVRKAEWYGGLYLDKNGAPCITEDMVLATLVEGAKQAKNGKQTKKAVLGAAPTFKLDYDGPKDLEKLYADPSFVDVRPVAVMQSRVMRTRPKFNDWACTVDLIADTELMDIATVLQSFEVAGWQAGFGDFRPRFGRFEVKRV